jgi:co-chaperonin GroES (HSP10)
MKKSKIIAKKITPLFTRILVTADVYTDADSVAANGIIDPKKVGTMKNIQKVTSIGSSARFVKIGDIVSLSFARYAVKSINRAANFTGDISKEGYQDATEYRIPLVDVAGTSYLFIDEGDVEYIIDEYDTEEVEVNMSNLVSPAKSLIIH